MKHTRRGMSQAGLPPRSVGATSNAKTATFTRSSWESWPSWRRKRHFRLTDVAGNVLKPILA
ncbi:MAG TPA: hypothetical protein VN699_14535 [Pirellulales bacterium]|nr:hypothetical protein [Pirellulales bacterium]